ncbi:uncharacterized protein LOC136008181 isoform X2 [Lathamus discolor]|uniref:uncharacterized protein LOC136008181 isoform X2 n=1 Tax=Lathamus discolor TaxID=678569 RepID=UPI0032B70209
MGPSLGLWAGSCGWSPVTHSPAGRAAPVGIPNGGRLPGGENNTWRRKPMRTPPQPVGMGPSTGGGGCQACVWQEPLTFEDIAVYLSRTEWDTITAGQRELYRSVMMDNYRLLTSLGYTGPKPDILYRMERGEEPWVCSSHSPLRGKGADCPSLGEQEQPRSCRTTPGCRQWAGLPPLPNSCRVEGHFHCQESDIHLSAFSAGCAGAMRLLKVPPWGWWPGAGAPEERAQSPCQEPQTDRRQTPTSTCSEGGQGLQCHLQPETLLNKLRCLMDHSKAEVEVGGRGVAPVQSENHAQTVVWPKKEETAENKHGVTANIAQGRELTLKIWMEQQNHKSYPQEHLYGDPEEQCQRSTDESSCPSGEAPFLLGPKELCAKDVKEAIWKDHCYCRVNVMQMWHRGPGPCPPTDHSYCQLHVSGSTVLKDHAYCRPQRTCFRARVGNVAHLGGKARAVLHRLATRRAQIRQIIRKAKRIIWRCNSHISRRLRVPRRSASTGSPVPAVPSGKVESVPMEGRCEALGSPAECEATLPLSESRISSREALCTPVASPAPLPVPPPSEAAVVASSKVVHLEVSAHSEEQPVCSSDVNQSTKGHEPPHSDQIPLHTAYKTLMWTVDHVFGSACHKLELNSYGWHADTWPFIIRMDS